MDNTSPYLHYYKKPKMPPLYTESYRDPLVWESIRAILQEVKNNFPKQKVNIFRAWSAGCATGEEAYSLASTLEEIFTDVNTHWKVYATDIQPKICNLGATTVHSLRIQAPTSADNIRFRYHNLVADRPLAHMNLILCRNVMMFMKKEYQEVVCNKLYESLRTGGYLVLGKAEQLRGETVDKLIVVDKGLRIYRK